PPPSPAARARSVTTPSPGRGSISSSASNPTKCVASPPSGPRGCASRCVGAPAAASRSPPRDRPRCASSSGRVAKEPTQGFGHVQRAAGIVGGEVSDPRELDSPCLRQPARELVERNAKGPRAALAAEEQHVGANRSDACQRSLRLARQLGVEAERRDEVPERDIAL